jgi:DNA-binding MarR family transcriptional regulator
VDATEEIVEHLFALVDRLRGGFDQVVSAFDLSAPQAKALHYVAQAGPVPMRDLACRLRCDASNVTGIVDRLEQRGLLERRSAPTDRRIKSLVATTEGVALAERVWAQVRRGTLGLMALSMDERAELVALLRRLDPAGEAACWLDG